MSEERENAWQLEKEFWQRHTVDTYDLETHSWAMQTYEKMVKQPPRLTPENFHHGDWVRAEDYRAHIEVLEAKVSKLEDQLQDALWNAMGDHL
jgi:cytochrome c556